MSDAAGVETRKRFVYLWAVRLERNAVVLGCVLGIVICAVAIAALLIGDYPMTVPEVIGNLFGVSADPLGQYFVQSQRLPRVIAACGVGMGLGIAGNIFQQLSGNTLGSPDIIGFSTGAATGAVLAITVFQASPAVIAGGALVGGLLTAAAVYGLSLRNQKISATRLVLVGIGTASILQAANGLMVVRANLGTSQNAAQWLAGSFNATTWTEVAFALCLLAVLLPVALLLARPLGVLTTGDDLATGLGVPVEYTRGALTIVGVILTALCVAIAGPIAFVALAAPQLAKRLSRASGVGMGNSALIGAVLVLASDLIAQRIFAPTQLPVGVVTGLLGGVYLVWLLGRQWRSN